MSATGIVISCAIGAAVFAWAHATTRPPKGEESSDLLLSAKFAAIASGSFAILAFVFASLFSGTPLTDVFLADVPGRQLRKVVYFAYGTLTVSLLFCGAFAAGKLRSKRSAA